MAGAFTWPVNASVVKRAAVVAFSVTIFAQTCGSTAAENNPELVPLTDAEDLVNAAASPFKGMPEALAGQFCSIVIGSPGVLMASLDMLSLSSDVMGGRAGRATLTTTNASFSVVYDAPVAFHAMPSGNVPPTVFAGKLQAKGATTLFDHPAGTPAKLKRGVTEIDVSLTASAQGGTYPAGHYATEAVLRCE